MAERKIRKYKRKDGTTVRAHKRTYEDSDYNKDFKEKLKTMKVKPFELQVETAIYVPSTKGADQKISADEFKRRVSQVKIFLAKLYGGYSSVEVEGGYWSDDKKKEISEKDVRVVAFSTKEEFKKNEKEIISYLLKLKKEWTQESMGYELDGEMYYI